MRHVLVLRRHQYFRIPLVGGPWDAYLPGGRNADAAPSSRGYGPSVLRAARGLLAPEARSRPERRCRAHSTLFSAEASRRSRRQRTWLRKNVQRRCWFALCLTTRSSPPSPGRRAGDGLSATCMRRVPGPWVSIQHVGGVPWAACSVPRLSPGPECLLPWMGRGELAGSQAPALLPVWEPHSPPLLGQSPQ